MTTPVNLDRVPSHVAIIMDGNGRWAKSRNLPRTKGHAEGVKRVEELIKVASKMGIKVLTLFTFSTENWTRPQSEVSTLMRTLCHVLNQKVEELKKGNIRFQMIGEREGIPLEVRKSLEQAVQRTINNNGMVLNLAFNYGSRKEIINAVRSICREEKQGKIRVEDIDEEKISEYLYTKGLPDPDLLIRTSGEKRISNFLLWQLSYSEFYFTDVFWPDFNEAEFVKALQEYQSRERRFGNV